VLRWALQLAILRVRSTELKEMEIVLLRHELAILRRRTGRPPMTLARSTVACGGQSAPAAPTLAVLHHHTGDAAGLASALGREALDIRASTPSCATTRSTWLCGLAVVELEQAAESLTTLHRAAIDFRHLGRDAFVAETLVGPFFMIVTHKFFDGRPEMPFAEQHHSVQALGLR
jgi:hypothetical protein